MKNKYIEQLSKLLLCGVLILGVQRGFSQSDLKNVNVQEQAVYEEVKALELTEFKKLQLTEAVVLDSRPQDEFSKGYTPQAIQIGWNGPFKTWVPKILVDKNQPILLIADESVVKDVSKTLLELGYKHVLGYLKGGIRAYKQDELLYIDQISAQDYLDLSNQGQIIDVRAEKEFIDGHIDNAVNFPLKDLANFNLDLPQDKKYYLQCFSGYRSMIAVSILKAKGMKNIVNIKGGYQALKKLKEEK